MNRSPIRVLLVEDSPVAVAFLQRVLATAPDIELAGVARTGVEALELLPEANPDVICTDLHMPKMNGLELTRAIMAGQPKPILVISASVQEDDDAQNIFQLLSAGAVDVFPKPKAGFGERNSALQAELIAKIRVLAGVRVFSLRRDRAAAASPPAPTVAPAPAPTAPARPAIAAPSAPPPPRPSSTPWRSPTVRAVAIGASTGGPQALQTLLGQFPADFPVPIFAVQHISEGFLGGLTAWLAGQCALSVAIARGGDAPQPGTVYFPPEGHHLQLDRRGCFALSRGLPVGGHRPSVTVLFEAVAQFYGKRALGILLTGMGQDGAAGLKAIAEAGGVTVAQNEDTCVVFGMPRSAIALGAVQHVLPLEAIGPLVRDRLLYGRGVSGEA